MMLYISPILILIRYLLQVVLLTISSHWTILKNISSSIAISYAIFFYFFKPLFRCIFDSIDSVHQVEKRAQKSVTWSTCCSSRSCCSYSVAWLVIITLDQDKCNSGKFNFINLSVWLIWLPCTFQKHACWVHWRQSCPKKLVICTLYTVGCAQKKKSWVHKDIAVNQFHH